MLSTHQRSERRDAFTLVELLVVLAIIGVLVGLLLPAVQMSREASRRLSCSNNLKNLGLAIHSFHDSYGRLPIGSEQLKETEHAWSARILPYLEQSPLYNQIDFRRAWNAPLNLPATLQNVPVYRCPSAIQDFAGKQDYGGIFGTSLMPLAIGTGPQDAFGCGALIVTSKDQAVAPKFAGITDGLSNTLCVGESVDRDPSTSGRWACGRNCFSQNSAVINHSDAGELFSWHPQGAHGLYSDGHVTFLTLGTDRLVLGAICTRNGQEVVAQDSP